MRYLTPWNNASTIMLDYARAVPNRVGDMFHAFDDIFEQATLPEEGTIITKSRMVTERYRVEYDEDGVIKLVPEKFNQAYEEQAINEEQNDSNKS